MLFALIKCFDLLSEITGLSAWSIQEILSSRDRHKDIQEHTVEFQQKKNRGYIQGYTQAFVYHLPADAFLRQ